MFATEKFINEVEKRPPLYNIKLKEYSNRELKIRLWEEISVQMFEDWSEISVEEKNKRGKELQTRWKSLKDQFRREIKALRESNSGQSAPKKKKYIFFDKLSFLSSCIEQRSTVSNISDDNIGEPKHNDHQEDAQSTQRPAATSTTPRMKNPRKKTRSLKYGKSEIKEITKVLSESVALQREEKSEDKFGNRAFLLSLLPLMNQFSEDIMLDCRMKIMQVIQEFRGISNVQSNRFTSTSSGQREMMQDLRCPTCSLSSQPSTPQSFEPISQIIKDENTLDSQEYSFADEFESVKIENEIS